MRCLKGNLISESPRCQRTVMNCCHVRGSLGRAKHTITTTAYSRHLALRTELSSSELRTQLFKLLLHWIYHGIIGELPSNKGTQNEINKG